MDGCGKDSYCRGLCTTHYFWKDSPDQKKQRAWAENVPPRTWKAPDTRGGGTTEKEPVAPKPPAPKPKMIRKKVAAKKKRSRRGGSGVVATESDRICLTQAALAEFGITTIQRPDGHLLIGNGGTKMVLSRANGSVSIRTMPPME